MSARSEPPAPQLDHIPTLHAHMDSASRTNAQRPRPLPQKHNTIAQAYLRNADVTNPVTKLMSRSSAAWRGRNQQRRALAARTCLRRTVAQSGPWITRCTTQHGCKGWASVEPEEYPHNKQAPANSVPALEKGGDTFLLLRDLDGDRVRLRRSQAPM